MCGGKDGSSGEPSIIERFREIGCICRGEEIGVNGVARERGYKDTDEVVFVADPFVEEELFDA